MNYPPLSFIKEARPLYERFLQDTLSPQVAFQETWEEIYGLLSSSAFWKLRGLKEQLQENHFTTYEDYKKVLSEAKDCDQSPLNNELVLNWTLSSGSSGPSKVFPITASYKTQVDEQHLCFIYEYLRRYPRLFGEPLHYLAAAGPKEHNPQGVGVSYISNFNYRNLPSSLREHFGVPHVLFKSEADLAHWRAVYMLAADCSAILAGAPAAVINLLEQIKAHGKEYSAYLCGNLPLPSHLPALCVSEGRKRELQESGLSDGDPLLEKLWPGLQFVACWTSGICSMQANSLRGLLNNAVPVIPFPFASTEAWMTICLSDQLAGGAINPRGALVEFSPVGEDAPVVFLRPWELKKGQMYEMFITNKMGLVRYRIQDVVECVGHFNNVAEIAFVRKASQEISLAGTTFNETELLSAIQNTPETRDGLCFFSPNEQGRGLTLYFCSETNHDRALAQKIEEKLFELNPQYQEDVEAGLLHTLELRVVTPRSKLWSLNHAQAKLSLIRHLPPDPALLSGN